MLEMLARAENRTPTNCVETVVLRDMEAREEAARVITMFVPQEGAEITPGVLLWAEGESDERYAERSALMDKLFAIPTPNEKCRVINEGAFFKVLFPTKEKPREPGLSHICYCLAVRTPIALVAYTNSGPSSGTGAIRGQALYKVRSSRTEPKLRVQITFEPTSKNSAYQTIGARAAYVPPRRHRNSVISTTSGAL